ncbi:MAG: hypothetical protein KA248_01650 [Kiritimatiellae bacterium]|nr:hypothetical protein [Kiritimatiellia bacterium]
MSALRTIARGLAAALALACAGCGPGKESPPAPAGGAAVLDPLVPNPSWGPDLFPGAERFSAADDPARVLPLVGPDRVLVIPEARGLPMHWWAPLEEHLAAGGAVLFCGRAPFEDRLRVEDGRVLTGAAALDGWMAKARSAGAFSSVRTWRHENESDELRGGLRLAESGEAPWPAIEVEVEGFREWDAVTYRGIRPGVVATGENSLAFYARGDTPTSRLFVECRERDGSRWGVAIEVSESWSPFLRRQDQFRYLGGGRGRGVAGDGFRLEQLSSIRIGLDMARAPQSPGAHAFGLSEVRLVADDRPARESFGWPDLPMVSPPDRRYETVFSALRDLEQGGVLRLAAAPGGSPAGWPRGVRETAAGRWIPMRAAEDERGRVLGWPVSLFLAGRAGESWRRWGWMAFDPAGPVRPAAARAAADAIRRLSGGLYFRYAGCPQWVYRASEEILVRACWDGPRGVSGVGVSAELRRESDGQVLRRAMLPAVAPGRPFEISLGLAAVAGGLPEDHRVVIVLEDLRRPGLFHDRVEQGLKVLPDPLPVTPPLTTEGGRFEWRSAPFAMAGFRYEPGAVAGESWLNPAFFDADLVRRDLHRLNEAGFNTVFLRYADENEAAPLRYVLEEARRREIMIVLGLAGLDPVAPDEARIERLLRAADLAGQPAVVALALEAGEALAGDDLRRRLDPAWRAWQAEAPGRDTESPALYGKFLQDFMSRRIGWVRRHLQDLGFSRMLTVLVLAEDVRTLFPSMLPGAAHVDFLSLSLAGPFPREPDWDAIAAAAESARLRSGGKPLVWQGGGLDVGPHPRAPDFSNQERWFQRFAELVMRTEAAGMLAWSFPGGWCPARERDIGLAGADGVWRPAGQAWQAALPLFRRAQAMPLRRERDPQGDLSDLNAEWGRLEVDGRARPRRPGEPVRLRSGQILKAELINSGFLSWEGERSAGPRVFVAVAGGPSPASLPVRPLRLADREWITWRAPASGTWTLQPQAAGHDRFGEPLRLEVGVASE